MDLKLEEAAHAGDVTALQQLLKQDRFLLHQPKTVPYPSNNPLHVAAMLGHSEFTREVIFLNSDHARDLSGQGLSSLHLASDDGHPSVVRELVSAVGSDLCLLCHKDGFLPIHTAAMNGRVCVLEEIMNVSSELVRAQTCVGINILHSAVRFNCFEAIKLFVKRLDKEDDHEFIKSRDAMGNTILHLATTRKQLEILKLLLSKPWADAHVMNSNGSTILDVLLDSLCQYEDGMLGEMIRTAGGRTRSVEGKNSNVTIGFPIEDPLENTSNWQKILMLFLKNPLASIELDYLIGVEEPHYVDYYKIASDTLLIVATLIATIAFQGGLSPPGCFAQLEDVGRRHIKALLSLH